MGSGAGMGGPVRTGLRRGVGGPELTMSGAGVGGPGRAMPKAEDAGSYHHNYH